MFQASVSNPGLPEPEKTRKPGFLVTFQKPETRVFSPKNPGFQKKHKIFQNDLSYLVKLQKFAISKQVGTLFLKHITLILQIGTF